VALGLRYTIRALAALMSEDAGRVLADDPVPHGVAGPHAERGADQPDRVAGERLALRREERADVATMKIADSKCFSPVSVAGASARREPLLDR
jgi:hypothetical protein